MAQTSGDMKRWALIGAKARILELSQEIEAIRAAFPGEFGLRGGRKKDAPSATPRKQRKLSAAGRKAISDAAKARWAKVKAEKTDSAAKGGKKR